jgi:hypothetical protein
MLDDGRSAKATVAALGNGSTAMTLKATRPDTASGSAKVCNHTEYLDLVGVST